MPSGGVPASRSSRALILVILLCFIAIIAAGVLFYQSQEVQIKGRVITDLSSIALLKSNQIEAWRGDRLGDARVITSGLFFTEGSDHYLTNGDNESREKILSRFREMNASYHYDNILLVDPQGNVRISLDPSITSVPPSVIDQVNASFNGGDAVMTDLYLMPGSRSARMEVIAPLFMKRNGISEPVGAVLLSINPKAVLYPLIQSWPVPSTSAETLLVERNGDDVLFLNDLRNQNNTALNLTIPLTRAEVPAVMAVQGITGAFEGKDYRNVDVISVLEPIPGSPWLMVAKIDTREAYSSLQSQGLIIIVLVAGILAGAIIIIGFVWQRRQKYYYRTLYSAETERRREEQRNRERSETLLQLAEMESASQKELADFVLDAGCRLTNSPLAFIGVMSADELSFDITAWSKAVMKDCSVTSTPIHFSIAKAGIWAEAVRQRTPFLVNDYTAPQPGKKGLPPGHVPITRFVSVPVFAGQRIVMVCAVANSEINYTDQDVDNLTLLMQGVWSHLQKRLANEVLREKNADLEAAYEEITAREEELAANYDELVKSQQALAESERKYRNLYQYAQVGLFETSMKDATVIACNDRYATLAGFSSIKEAIGKDILHLYADAEDRTEVSRILREKGSIENHTVKFKNPHTGAFFWVQFSARYNYERDVAEGSLIDITVQKEALENLRISEERYRLILETMQDAYFRADGTGTLTMVNPAAVGIYGYPSPEAMIGIPAASLYKSPEERAAILRQLNETGCITDYIGQGRRKDGSFFWVSLNIHVTSDATGKIVATEGFVRDITDRKMAEEALRESETRLRTILKKAPVPMCYLDKDGVFTFRNERFVQVFGYTAEDIPTLAEWWQKAYPDEQYRQRVIATWDAAIRDAVEKGTDIAPIEYRVTCKDKKERIIEITGINLGDNLLATFIDLTARKQAEEALRESETRLSFALEAGDAGAWEWNPGTDEVSFDARFHALLGYVPGELPTTLQDWLSWYNPEDVPEWKATIGAYLRGDIPVFESEYRIRTKTGDWIWIFTRGQLVKPTATGAKKRFIGIAMNITGRKQAEIDLAAEQQRYRDLFENVDIGILRSTPGPGGTIIEANPAALRIFEAESREQFFTVHPSALYSDASERQKISDEILANGAIHGKEIRFKTLKGRMIWGRITAMKKTSDSGEIYFDNTIEDITERKEAQEALFFAHERLQSFIDANVVGFVIATPEGEIIETNDYYLHLIGYTREESEQGIIDWRSLTPPEWLPSDEHAIEELREQGKCTPYEKEYIRRDGTRVSVLLADTMLSGPVEQIAALVLDVTERKRAEKQLHETNEYLRNLIDYANAPIIVWNPEFRITRFNHAFERLTGRTEQEVVGRHLALLFPETSRDASLELIKKTLSGERWDVVEIPVQHTSGEIRIVLWNSATLFSEDEKTVIATIAQGQDITDRKSVEDALRDSEEKYRELFENITSGFALHEIVLDDVGKPIDYRFLMVNPAFEQMTGLDGAAIINRSVLDVLPGTEPHWIETYGRVALSGKPERFENFSQSLNKWFEVLVYRPKPGQFATVLTDITERIRVEEALRTNEHELDALFRSMINAFGLFDSVFDDNGTFVSYRFVRINDAFERITGVKNDEVRGKTVQEVWPGTEPGWIRAYGEVAVTGVPSTFDMYHEPTKKLYHSNVYRPGESRDRFCIIFEDITERMKAEEALRESEERFRIIFERTTAGKLLFSPEGNLLRINPAFAEMLGYTTGEMKEYDLTKITYPGDLAESRECIRALLAGEAPSYRMEKRFIHKTGRIVWTDVSTTLLKDNAGKPLYFITSILDITERKLTERQRELLIKELEQKNAELERFTYTVSHDLKSPLITIRGFAGLLEDDALKGDQLQLKKDIRRILDAAATMQALLADLLELSRIGRVINPPEKISFTRIAREAVDILAGPLAERGVAVEIAPDLPDVMVDHTRIREVLVNLIENSTKFLGDQSDPVIRIGTENTGKEPFFFVQDNGIGINPRYLERIFNLFEKLTPNAPGTGIGLAIVRRIIEVHGGRVWVESEGQGMGTKVCFTLPVAPVPKEGAG